MVIYRLHSTKINYITTIKYTFTYTIVAIHPITNNKEEAVQLVYYR